MLLTAFNAVSLSYNPNKNRETNISALLHVDKPFKKEKPFQIVVGMLPAAFFLLSLKDANDICVYPSVKIPIESVT